MKLAFRFSSNSTTFIQIQQNFSQRTGFSDVLIRFPFFLFFSSFLRFWPPKIGQSGHSREARQLYRAANSIYRIKTDGCPMILFLFVLLICAQNGWMDRSGNLCLHIRSTWWSEVVVVVAMNWGDIRVAGTSCSLAVVPALLRSALSCSYSPRLSIENYSELVDACLCSFWTTSQSQLSSISLLAPTKWLQIRSLLVNQFVTSVCQLFVLIHSALLHQNSDISIRAVFRSPENR